MKNILFISLFLLIILPSCKKYEEGPLISLRSAEKRLNGEYELKEFTVDGIDSLVLYQAIMPTKYEIFQDEYELENRCFVSGLSINTIYEDNYYQYTFLPEILWTWELSKNNKYFKVVKSIGNTNGIGPIGKDKLPEWEISKLTNKNLKLKTYYINKEYKISLVKIIYRR